MVLQGIKDKEKQGDKEVRRQRRRVDVTREIWEDPGKIQGRSRGRCDREGKRNKVEKRREDMRGDRECIRERAKGESRGSSMFRSVGRRSVGESGKGFEEREQLLCIAYQRMLKVLLRPDRRYSQRD